MACFFKKKKKKSVTQILICSENLLLPNYQIFTTWMWVKAFTYKNKNFHWKNFAILSSFASRFEKKSIFYGSYIA